MTYEWINARERFNVPKVNREPKVDEEVSKAVGKKVFVNDPRLIAKIAEFKREKKQRGIPDGVPDNFLQDSKNRARLKEALR